MTRDRLIVVGALSGAVAIMAGAFGAHGTSGEARELLKTGGLYELVHAVAAIMLTTRARGVAWLMLAGSIVFAFSLYGLALGTPGITGAITPIGGLGMIAGWLWLAWRAAIDAD